MQHFSDAGLPVLLTQALENMGFTTPTPIQSEAIPIALEGKDVLGSAQTGTGKTGAFGIPLVAKLLNDEQGMALVLTPTRELAAQVLETIKKMLSTTQIKTALLIGGDPMFKQMQQLKAKPRVIIGTPGRINDHLNRGSLKLHNAHFLVLDETDRMLDMGFGIQLEQIAKHLPKKRQTLMFSATMPHNIMQLSNKYLTEPVRIEVGSNSAPAAAIKQEHVHLRESEKYPHLLTELETREGSVIIFVKTKWGADQLAQKLTNDNHEADALHGDLRQKQRDRVVSSFRREHYRVLVATDVAARGLDIPHIAHVINYDMPQNPEDYIHRIGRTARAGAEGCALNMLAPSDGGKWRAIQRLLNPNEKPERSPYADNNNRSDRGGERRPSRDGGRSFGERKPYGDRKPREDRGSFGGERNFDRKPREDRGNFGGERKAFGDRSERSFDRKPREDRGSFGGERNFDRKPREDRGNFGGERKPFGDRNERSFDRKPRENQDAYAGERVFERKQSNDRKPFGDRPERNFGERKPFGDRGDRPSFGDRKPREDRGNFGGERNFDRKPREDRGDFGGERSFGNRGERPSFDRKPREDRGSFGGERKSFGERKPFGDRSERPSFGDRKPSGDRAFGDKKPFGEKKSFGDKPFGEKRSFGDKKPSGPRRSESESFFNDRSSAKPAGKRAFSDKRGGGDKPFSRKKNFA